MGVGSALGQVPVGGTATPAIASVCYDTGTNITLTDQIGGIEKWQFSTDNWATTNDIASTDNPLATGNLTNSTRFRAAVTNGEYAAVYSSDAVVTVDAVPVGGTAVAGASVVCANSSTTITLSGQTGGIAKWQSSTDNWATTNDIVSVDNPLTTGNLAVSTVFRAVVTNGVCGEAYSTVATVGVDAAPVGGNVLTASSKVCFNSGTLLTLTNLTGGIEKWQATIDNWATTNDILSTDNPLTASNLTVTTVFRAVVTNGICGTAYSSEAVVALDTTPPVMVAPTNFTVNCSSSWSFGTPLAVDNGLDGVVVYDNSVNDLVSRFDTGTNEVGNEIILAGTERYLEGFSFEFWSTNLTGAPWLEGTNVSVRLRFYANDGTNFSGYATPRTVLYDSGEFWLGTDTRPRATVVYDEFDLWLYAWQPLMDLLPPTFTWTVQFSGLGASDRVGVDLYSPPVIGRSYGDFWLRTDEGWQLREISGLPTDIAARAIASTNRVTISVVSTVTNASSATSFVATRTWMATDACGNSSTCAQSVTVEGGPVITSDLTNQTVCAGSAVAWSVAATGSGLNYQWWRAGTNLLEGADEFTGTTSPTLTKSAATSADSLDAAQGYACTVTGPCGLSVTSSIVALRVEPVSAGGVATPGSPAICSGSAATIGLSGQTGAIVKWQSSTDAGATWSDLASTNNPLAVLIFVPVPGQPVNGPLTIMTAFRAVVQNGMCGVAMSGVANIMVDATTAGGAATPVAPRVCSGSGTAIGLSGQTGVILRWQATTDGGSNWSDIPSADNPLSTGNLTQATAYRALVQNGVCGVATSGVATVTVDLATVGGAATPIASQVCSGSGTTIDLQGQVGAIVKWQASGDGGSSWSDIPSADNPLSTGNLTQTTAYRALVQSGVCGMATSGVATVTVDLATVGGTATPVAAHLCNGSGTTIGLSGQTGAIVKWQASSDGGGSWLDLASTANPLATGNLATNTLFRAVVTNGVCGAAYSTEAAVAVDAAPFGGTAIAAASVVCSNSGTSIFLTNWIGGIAKWQSSSDNWVTTNDLVSVDNPLATGNLTVNTLFRAVVTNGVCDSVASTEALVVVDMLSASATFTAIACHGGGSIVTVTASGGGAPYAGTGEFPTAAGSHTYTVSDTNGCTASVTVNIPEPAALVASAGVGSELQEGSPALLGGSPTASGGTPGYTYQWSPTAGLNDPSLANPTATPATTTVYTVTVTDANGCTATAPVTVTVIPDTVPPTVIGVVNIGSTNVQLTFSEALESTSATNTANFVFTNGLAISGVVQNATNLLTLSTAPLVYGSNYVLVINGVRDRAFAPNTIATNTEVSFVALPFITQDIGVPSLASTLTVTGSNGVDIAAAGKDVGGASDQFSFSYQPHTGDFDVSVRLADLGLLDLWAKAGWMARETLDPASRFAASLATPGMNGSFFEWRDPTNSLAHLSGSFPVNYPDTWLRLARVGDAFTGFASYDGQTWVQLGTATIPMPSEIYLGLAVSSHSSNQLVIAQFRDSSEVAGALPAALAPPREPLGPSSRKTPVVFSEIMYKPAARADSNNLEFIEIYNSNPWFHDIGGYQDRGGRHELHLPGGDDPPGRGFPGRRRLAGQHPSRLWHHQCRGALHRQPEEIRHAPVAGRAAGPCC